ncbi:MAG: alanine racemase [Anaerolineales bacterium]|jgi:alanine racemase
MPNSTDYSTWVEVDLSAIENNIRRLIQLSGVQLMAVVKANAYGHGAVPVAQAALRAGAAWCGVARLEEALELRRAGLDCPILLLGYTPPDRLDEAVASRVSLTLWNVDQAQAAAAAGQRVGVPARVHLKVDSGMGRLGVQAEDVLSLARSLPPADIQFEGVFTHFARADEADPAATEAQEWRFAGALEALQASGRLPPVVHASNSAAGLTRPKARFTLVRAGIAMYGLHPSAECPLPDGLLPALTWKTVLSQVKVLPAGRGVSYGHTYVTQGAERIGTAPVGYADGYRRTTGNVALVGGQRVPVVGRVCMDQIMLQLDGVRLAQAGDEVLLIGQQAGACLRAEDLAQIWGTINYEVVCGIGARVPRLYV